MRQIDRDVDPDHVAAGAARRAAYAIQTAAWGNPRRCQTQIVDHDGSCVACGAIQGENCLTRNLGETKC